MQALTEDWVDLALVLRKREHPSGIKGKKKKSMVALRFEGGNTWSFAATLFQAFLFCLKINS